MNLPNPDCEVDCLDVLWKQLVRNFAWSKQVRIFMKCHGVPIYAWSKKVRNLGSVIKANNTYFKPKTPTNNPAEESTYADSKPNYTDGKTMKITTSDAMQLHSENPLERVWLRIVDTPGYGDNLDATRDFRQIRDFINAQYKSRYAADTAKDANNNLRKSDNLITCCLYFIAPHRLKENDIAFMKEISKMVIPFHPTFHRF